MQNGEKQVTTALFRPGNTLVGIFSEGLAVAHPLAAAGKTNLVPPFSLSLVLFSLKIIFLKQDRNHS